MNKHTLVLGASLKPERFSNKAIKLLLHYGHKVKAIGLRDGFVDTVKILKIMEPIEDIHTITLYLNPDNQLPFYDYILSLKPKRVIFNPGTENPELVEILNKQNIQCVEYCTLVMLNQGKF